jgi:D-serine deaminase-like pyridoxal phosphate-dependent protein
MRRAAIGISAHLGWAATTTIAVARSGVRILRTDHLEIAKPADRESREPYHVAGGFEGLERVLRPSDPERALEGGLQRQRRSAARVIGKLASALEADGTRLAFAGLLVSRGRAASSFDKAVGSHTQIHIEEGIAIRESLRLALVDTGVRVVSLDQKALWPQAVQELGRSEASLLSALRALRPENEGPWRKEERSAALAAWIAWLRSAR